MKSFNYLRRLTLVAVFLTAGIAGAAEYNAPEADSEGVIQELNFAANQALINGSSYDVSRTVNVEINGSYGAFTMLTTGMKVEFSYLHYSDGVKQITSIREVAEIEEI